MRNIVFALFIFLAQPMLSQVLTNEQKDFCIATFGNYLNMQEDLIKERVEILKSLNTTEADIVWFKDNIIRIDSVMNASIALVKKDDYINLANLLERERYNIYAHPHNDTYLCYDFHSVMALIYSNIIEDDKEYELVPGFANYCGKGKNHSIKNIYDEDLELFAVITKQ